MAEELYGYGRVSAKDQNEARQLFALMEYGVRKSHIFIDKRSGKDFDRPQYRALLGRLRHGDVLAVKSIDRLGRNYEEILVQWRHITKRLGVAIVVLDMPLLDTRQGRDLTGTLISDIVLQLLSYVAQTERENIHQRQAEGIAAARAAGKNLGRARIPVPREFFAVREAYRTGAFGSRAAAERLGVSPSTFRRWVRREGSPAPGSAL